MEELLQKHKKRLKIIFITLVSIALIALAGMFVISNEDFFRAEVLEYLGGRAVGEGDFYIPNNYQAESPSVGEIEIICNTDSVDINALKFDLEYNKDEIEIINIEKSGTRLNEFFPSLNTNSDLGASVLLVGAYPVTVYKNDRIVKFGVSIKSGLATNTEIKITPSNVTLMENASDETSISISAGKITVVGEGSDVFVIESVTPDQFSNKEDKTVTIKGSGFSGNTRIFFGNNEIDDVDVDSTSIINIIVPAGKPPNFYDIIARDNGKEAKKTAAIYIVEETSENTLEFLPDEFFTTPSRVDPDGATPIVLSVALTDSKYGIGNIDANSVRIDLRKIGGSESTLMTKGDAVGNKQFFNLEITVPTNVKTQTDPYALPVMARNIYGGETTGEIEVLVSKTSYGSVPPEVVRVYTKPSHGISAGQKVNFYAEVNDDDGIEDIDKVYLDLTPLNGPPVKMLPVTTDSDGTGTNGTEINGTGISSQFYIYEGFKIPASVDKGTHELQITATDKSNEVSKKSFNVKIGSEGGSSIEEIYTQPPKDIVSGQNISFFVRIRNENGVRNIDNVVINLIPIGGTPAAMRTLDFNELQTGYTGGSSSHTAATTEEPTIANTEFTTETTYVTDDGNAGAAYDGSEDTGIEKWYALINFPIPTDRVGKFDIEITVNDKQTGKADSKKHKITVLSADEATHLIPIIDADKSYTNPYVTINDEKTPFTVYVFVKHQGDIEIESAIMNLKNIGKLAENPRLTPFATQSSEPPGDLSADIFESGLPPPQYNAPAGRGGCATNSNTIICLEKIAAEGRIGSWFKSPELVINQTTIPSTDPYFVDISVTDTQGRIGQGLIPIVVNDGRRFLSDNTPPKVHLAVSTSPDTVEILFTEELDPVTVRRDGSNFKITEFTDTSKRLTIKKATLNASATIVTLETNKQKDGEYYAVTADTRITDAIGIPIAKGAQNRARFIGFQPSKNPPVVRTVTAVSPNLVEVVFIAPLKPSGLVLTFLTPEGITQATTSPESGTLGHLYYSGENFVIRPSGLGKDPLQIYGVNFGTEAHIIQIETDTQQSKQEYLLSGQNFAAYNGAIIKKGRLNKFFTGYVSKLKDAPELRRSADFNQDGKVDFIDFTIFSSFYGKVIGGEIDAENPPEGPIKVSPTPTNNQPPPENESDPNKSTPPDAENTPLPNNQPVNNNTNSNNPDVNSGNLSSN